MGKIRVSGEQPFRSQRETFAVGDSNGYTLSYSVDKNTWTNYPQAVPAHENLIVNGITPYMWFRLTGNEGEVDIMV